MNHPSATHLREYLEYLCEEPHDAAVVPWRSWRQGTRAAVVAGLLGTAACQGRAAGDVPVAQDPVVSSALASSSAAPSAAPLEPAHSAAPSTSASTTPAPSASAAPSATASAKPAERVPVGTVGLEGIGSGIGAGMRYGIPV